MLLHLFFVLFEMAKIIIIELGLYQVLSKYQFLMWNFNLLESCRQGRPASTYYCSNASRFMNLSEFYEWTTRPYFNVYWARTFTDFELYCEARKGAHLFDITDFQILNIHMFHSIWSISFSPNSGEIFEKLNFWVQAMHQTNEPLWKYVDRTIQHPTELNTDGTPVLCKLPHAVRTKYYESVLLRNAVIRNY